MDGTITMFGAVDRKENKKDGEIMSTEPAWFLENQLDELKEQIRQQESRISRGEVPSNELEYARSEFKKFKNRYDEIKESKPKLTGKDKDEFASFISDLSTKIEESTPSYDKIQRGHVDAQDEFKRQTQPCIKVNPEMAKAFGIETDGKGRVSGNDAVRMWKIGSKLLGESSFSEVLRREK